MIRRRFYSGTYDASKWASQQSAVPSQDIEVGIPYSPDFQPDVQQLSNETMYVQEFGAQTTPDSTMAGAPPPEGAACNEGNFLRYVFDSRPPLGYDFAAPAFANQFVANSDGSGAFTVPAGYIAIVRQIFFRPNTITGPVINIFGYATSPLMLTVLVDGQPQPGLTLIDGSNGYPCGVEIECFLMVRSGATVSGRAIFAGVDITANLQQTGFAFQGNLLIDDGRTLSTQSANKDNEPVCIAGVMPAAQPQMMPAPAQAAAAAAPQQPYCPKPPAISVNNYLACLYNNPAYADPGSR